MSSKTFHVRVTFFEPFRVTEWVEKDKQKSDKHYLRGLSFARRQNGKLLITGTLLRSALLKEVECLLAIENRYGCCPGKFVTDDPISLLRRRPTYQFSQKKEPCPEIEPCPFCLLLGRFDKKDKQNEKMVYSVRFSNLYASKYDKDSRERILNRVDFAAGKAKDYFKVWEVDHLTCLAFSGKIVIRDDLDRQEEVENLLAAGLVRIRTLCGALCRVDIIENGSIQRHQDLIVRYFDPNPILPPLPIQVLDSGEHIESTKVFSVEEPLLPNKEKFKKLAENIAKSLKAANKEPHQRRMADAVRDLRRFSHEKLQQLPEKTKDGSTTLWAVSSKENKSPKKLICEFVDAEKIAKDSWRKLCEKLGEALYLEEKNRQKKAEALPRLLGDTEYYGQPSVIDPGIEYSDPKTLPAYEWIMVGTLKAETPFCFGVESKSVQTSSAILLTSDGSYRLPRSVLRGALRRELKDVIGSGCNVELGSPVPCPCDVCRIMRCLTVMDTASTYKEPPEIRHRIRINQHSGIVDEGALFDCELGPEGLAFPFRLYLRSITKHLDKPIYEALERWRNGMAFLGGDGGTGKGHFVLADLKLSSFSIKNPPKLKMSLDHRGFVDCDTGLAFLNWQRYTSLLSPRTLPPCQKYKYEITLESPVLTNDPIAAMLKDKHADTTPVQKRVLEKDGGGGFKEKYPAPYFIKGEGIRGILRTAVGRKKHPEHNLPLHSLPHDDCDCILCALFGSEHHQGKLRFEDAHFETDPEPKTLDHVAIDRFTGGASDKFKFDDSPLIATPDKPLKLTGTFWLHRDMHEASEKLLEENNNQEGKETGGKDPGLEAARELRSAFMDLRDGMFPIGNNGGTGYGWVRNIRITGPDSREIFLDDISCNEESKEADEVSGNTKYALSTYKPPEELSNSLNKENHVFYPHYFLKPHNYVNRENRPVTHETYHENKLTGKISCRLKTLGPVFVPDSSNDNAYNKATIDEIKSGEYHKSYKFFRLNDEVMIAGSEIRGMISSVYEALTNLCFRVLDEKRILSKRMEATPKILNEFNPGRIDADGNIVKMKSYRLPLYDCVEVTEKIQNTYKGQELNSDKTFAKYAESNRKFLHELKNTGQLNDVLTGKKEVSFNPVEINKVDKIAGLNKNGKQTGYLKITGPNTAKISKSSNPAFPELDRSWELKKRMIQKNCLGITN